MDLSYGIRTIDFGWYLSAVFLAIDMNKTQKDVNKSKEWLSNLSSMLEKKNKDTADRKNIIELVNRFDEISTEFKLYLDHIKKYNITYQRKIIMPMIDISLRTVPVILLALTFVINILLPLIGITLFPIG